MLTTSEMDGHVVGTVDSRCCYTWTIDNFSFYSSDKLILSPEFPGDCSEKNWRLQLHPFGAYKDGNSDRPYVSLHLLLASFVPGNQNDVNFQLSILNDQDERVHKFSARRIQFNAHVGVGGCCRYFISREDLTKHHNCLLVDDQLRIHCQIWEESNYDEPSCSHQSESLSSTFWKLRLDRKLVDFTVTVNGEEFYFHKVMIAIRSPVFASLFVHKEGEKHSRMTITDCEPEVFEKFLRYLYLGSVDGLRDFAFDLLAMAEKYGVEKLKHMCEKSIASNITVENAARVFMISELHHAPCLKIKAMDFIKKHLLEIIDTESWKSLLISEPSLVNRVVRALAMSKNLNGEEGPDK